MLKFIEKLEALLEQWMDSTKLTPIEIAENTETALPYAVDYLSNGLDRSIDIHDPLSRKECEQAFTTLKLRSAHQIEAEHRRREGLQKKALAAYDAVMEKVRMLQQQKSWYQAYRTLTYFTGLHEAHLNPDTALTVYNDCLRLGFRAGVNLQELGLWLKKGIELCQLNEQPEGLEEAIDFLEAHANAFVTDRNRTGEKLIANLFKSLEAPAANFAMMGRLSEAMTDLNINIAAPTGI